MSQAPRTLLRARSGNSPEPGLPRCPVTAAKVAVAFAKSNEKLTIVGGALPGQLLALKFYFVCFSITIGTMAVMRALGVRYRWPHLDAEQRRSGMRQSIAALVVAIAMVAGVLLPSGTSFFGFQSAPMPANLLYAILFGGIAARLLRLATAKSRWGESDVRVAHA